jgi:DNA-binding NtrC family response regulator
MGRAKILIVDDEASPRESLKMILKTQHDLVLTETAAAALKALDEDSFDLVLLDVVLPDMSGLDLLQKIRAIDATLPVVMVTALDQAKPAIEALQLGALHYVTKPFSVDEIRIVVTHALKEAAQQRELLRLRAQVRSQYKFDNIIGASEPMKRVFAMLERVIGTDSTVLIHGETGTGKELVARAIHHNSARKDGPFVAVHCAAIPNELLESELFGHEKGSFTGAMQRRIGMFEAAENGTLFLDEIGEMPLGTQSKLLRAIQEREIRRVGGSDVININVRLVAATNRDLEADVKAGKFRDDLFYRINVVPVILPPLRERREDIPLLAHHFAGEISKRLGRVNAPQIMPQAMEILVNYRWPGNVRELEHCIERVLVTCDAEKILPEHLPPQLSAPPKNGGGETGREGGLTDIKERLEREEIEKALVRSNGVVSEAARQLRISRRSLIYKVEKFGLKAKDFSGAWSGPSESDANL